MFNPNNINIYTPPIEESPEKDVSLDVSNGLFQGESTEAEQGLIQKESPSVLKKLQGGVRKVVQNVIPDIRDNFETGSAPDREKIQLSTTEERAALQRKIFTFNGEDLLEKVGEKMFSLEPGTYICRIPVGVVEEGTRHPHDFIIESTDEYITYYFIDPEHSMGKQKKSSILRKGDIRPHVSTLVSLRVHKGTQEYATSMVRFRTGFIEDTSILKMAAQYKMAREIADSGELPEILTENENEVTFYMRVDSQSAEVASRYVSKEDIVKTLQGKPSASPLEGKINSYKHIINRGIVLLESDKFKKID